MKKVYIYIAVITVVVVLVIILLKNTTKSRIVSTAKTFLGQKETGKNTAFGNIAFQKEMKSAGWYPGAEWCAFFARMVWLKSLDKKHFDIANKLLSGSSQQTYINFSKDKSGLFKVSNTPSKGAIVIWQANANKAKGHAGIVTKVTAGKFYTIEGNREDSVMNLSYSFKNPNLASAKLRGFINIA